MKWINLEKSSRRLVVKFKANQCIDHIDDEMESMVGGTNQTLQRQKPRFVTSLPL